MIYAVFALAFANLLLVLIAIGATSRLNKLVAEQRDLDVDTLNKMFKEAITVLVENDNRVLAQAKVIANAAVEAKVMQILAVLPEEVLPKA